MIVFVNPGIRIYFDVSDDEEPYGITRMNLVKLTDYLDSALASYVRGHCMVVDGGRIAGVPC